MTIADLVLIMVVGHFIFDWLLQTEWMALNKKDGGLALHVHSAIYAIGVYVTLLASFFVTGWFPGGGGWALLGILYVSHAILDTYQTHVWWCKEVKRMNGSIHLWMIICIDQIRHFIILVGCAIMLKVW